MTDSRSGRDLFISYAWTSEAHRAWVRLLASHLLLAGFDAAIDEAVDYGSSLSGFMREVESAGHVLMVVDRNYVERADHVHGSGVWQENQWIQGAYEQKPAGWLATIIVNNPTYALPAWLTDVKPKAFDFNAHADDGSFPGARQIEDLWRWLEGLPASHAHAVPLATIRRKAARIERIDAARDPGNWASPGLSGRVTFKYRDKGSGGYTVGHGDYAFSVEVSEAGAQSVYVYADHVKAVGLVFGDASEPLSELDKYLTPGRVVTPTVGQSVVLMNNHGNICRILIEAVQREVNGARYIAPQVTFSYEILFDEPDDDD